MRVRFYDFFKYRHRVSVVINVNLIFIIVFSSSPINNTCHRGSNVVSLHSISGLLNNIVRF